MVTTASGATYGVKAVARGRCCDSVSRPDVRDGGAICDRLRSRAIGWRYAREAECTKRRSNAPRRCRDSRNRMPLRAESRALTTRTCHGRPNGQASRRSPNQLLTPRHTAVQESRAPSPRPKRRQHPGSAPRLRGAPHLTALLREAALRRAQDRRSRGRNRAPAVCGGAHAPITSATTPHMAVGSLRPVAPPGSRIDSSSSRRFPPRWERQCTGLRPAVCGRLCRAAHYPRMPRCMRMPRVR